MDAGFDPVSLRFFKNLQPGEFTLAQPDPQASAVAAQCHSYKLSGAQRHRQAGAVNNESVIVALFAEKTELVFVFSP